MLFKLEMCYEILIDLKENIKRKNITCIFFFVNYLKLKLRNI